jgi:serine protease Do
MALKLATAWQAARYPRLPWTRRICCVGLLCLALMATADLGQAGVYRYKDENGVWHFSDAPPAAGGAEAETFIGDDDSTRQQGSKYGKDLQKQLTQGKPLTNDIESARNATVSIRLAAGAGSGFFITADGYIVTNRHVVDPTSDGFKQNMQSIEDQKKELEFYRQALELEALKLKQQRDQLSVQRNQMDAREYSKWRDYLDAKEGALQRRYAEFETQERQFKEVFGRYEAQRLQDLFGEAYTIVLSDQTQLKAVKVAISQKYDLALLRLEGGYRTPILMPGRAAALTHGQSLFAIGNSLDMGLTVTSGVFSGHRGDLLQTNAQINPGNSGGPLVTQDGKVIGVNTQKVVHQSVEGVGFAIPIDVVYQEFGQYIQRPAQL